MRCKSLTKAGLRCRNKVSEGAFCYLHTSATPEVSSDNRLNRIAKLLAVGTALVTIGEKLCEKAPSVISYLVDILIGSGGVSVCAPIPSSGGQIASDRSYINGLLPELYSNNLSEDRLELIEGKIYAFASLIEQNLSDRPECRKRLSAVECSLLNDINSGQ